MAVSVATSPLIHRSSRSASDRGDRRERGDFRWIREPRGNLRSREAEAREEERRAERRAHACDGRALAFEALEFCDERCHIREPHLNTFARERRDERDREEVRVGVGAADDVVRQHAGGGGERPLGSCRRPA
jgi:hypothetical protein